MDAQTLQPGQDGYFENVIWPKRRRLSRIMNWVPWLPGRWLRKSIYSINVKDKHPEGTFVLRRGMGARWAARVALALAALSVLIAWGRGDPTTAFAALFPLFVAAFIRWLIWKAERIDDLIKEHGARIVILLDLYGNDVGDTATVAR